MLSVRKYLVKENSNDKSAITRYYNMGHHVGWVVGNNNTTNGRLDILLAYYFCVLIYFLADLAQIISDRDEDIKTK